MLFAETTSPMAIFPRECRGWRRAKVYTSPPISPHRWRIVSCCLQTQLRSTRPPLALADGMLRVVDGCQDAAMQHLRSSRGSRRFIANKGGVAQTRHSSVVGVGRRHCILASSFPIYIQEARGPIQGVKSSVCKQGLRISWSAGARAGGRTRCPIIRSHFTLLWGKST